ncbi:hypothetical protein Axi01nite_83570 [Actinoplanes xinjiangensis]|nr:hypothetical protein Axi01nite_83570 [Actinoplanes xinjiangensis]
MRAPTIVITTTGAHDRRLCAPTAGEAQCGSAEKSQCPDGFFDCAVFVGLHKIASDLVGRERAKRAAERGWVGRLWVSVVAGGIRLRRGTGGWSVVGRGGLAGRIGPVVGDGSGGRRFGGGACGGDWVSVGGDGGGEGW